LAAEARKAALAGKPTGRRRAACVCTDEGGQAIVEFAIAFPVQLFAVLAIMQMSLLFCAKQVLHVAAVRAVQAAVVAETLESDGEYGGAIENARFVAAAVCAPITGPTSPLGGSGGEADVEVPGWGRLPRSGLSLGGKTRVEVTGWGSEEVKVVVEHDYELIIPFVNVILAEGFLLGREEVEMADDLADFYGRSEARVYETPHLTLKSTAVMANVGPSRPPG